MKKTLLTIAILVISLGASSNAFAVITLDFNSLSTGYYAEGALSALFADVSFNNTGGNGFTVASPSLLADFSGNALLNNPYNTLGNSTVATFTQCADFVSVTMGDFAADRDDLYLNAYNSSSGLITSDYFNNPANSMAGRTLSVNDPTGSIAYVEFYGVGLNNNSTYWDNFSYNTYECSGGGSPNGGNVVPEPSSFLLLAFGLLGFIRKKFKK